MRDLLAYSARVMARVLAGGNLQDALNRTMVGQAQARPAVQEMTYATCRQLPALRYLSDALATHPIRDLPLQALLLVALQQLRRSNKPYAVVDQAVEAVVKLRFTSAKRLVNALLRQYLRRAEVLEQAIAADSALQYGYPEWWVERLQQTYAENWQAILAAGNEHPPLTLRVNLRRQSVDDYLRLCEAAGLTARQVGPAAIIVEPPVAVERLPGFAEGRVSVQDAAAQRAVPMLGLSAGMRVLDACAAPGGKTGHLLESTDLDVVALDDDERRLTRVADNLQRLQLFAALQLGDAARPEAWWDGKPFDAILADVPCTGSGVVRRHPDIKCLRTENDLQQSVRLQARILTALWRCLKPGGTLLYVTCSVFPEENSLQIKQFLETHDDAERLPLAQPGLGDGQLLPTPEHDGFYFARLAKRV